MNNKVNVVIGGEIITLKSSENAEYLQRIARYADEKIEEIKSKSKAAALDDRARSLIIALNIADDYHKAVDKFTRLDSLHKRLVNEMGKLQAENSKITEEMKNLKTELASTQKELDEFIKSFDTDNAPEAENILTLPQTKRKAR
jgi:cell division protein ZapA